MENNITIHTAAELAPFAALAPNGYVHAHVIEDTRISNDPEATFAYGACPICGHTTHRDGEYRAVNENDHVHARVYCWYCLVVERFSRGYIRRIIDGKANKANKRMTFVVEINPAEGCNNELLATALLTPSRTDSETVGRWYRKSDDNYSSTTMRNLKQLNTRFDSVFDTCAAGTITLDVLIDGATVETLTFDWGETRHRVHGRFVSDKNALMLAIDWEVGKYRYEGRGHYYHAENAARKQAERKGMNWRHMFR